MVIHVTNIRPRGLKHHRLLHLPVTRSSEARTDRPPTEPRFLSACAPWWAAGRAASRAAG